MAVTEEISDHDLKLLSLKFIGECDGTYYFRDATNPAGPAYSGDMADLKEHLIVKSAHPMVDAGTAAAVLEMRRIGKATTPFGTAAGDVIGS